MIGVGLNIGQSINGFNMLTIGHELNIFKPLSSGPPPEEDGILLETGDDLLLETGDRVLTE